jgi:hypothetical protein
MYFEGCSEKIATPNKAVEIDENKFGWLKYHKRRAVVGLWVFGCVE